MVCIYCSARTQVVNSRHQVRTNQVWRRRQCQACQNVFTTLEAADLTSSLLFRKNKAHVEPFSRDKLFLSVYDTLKHRKDALQAATALCDTILGRIATKIDNAGVDRSILIQTATEVLKRFDRPASVMYAAYHPA